MQTAEPSSQPPDPDAAQAEPPRRHRRAAARASRRASRASSDLRYVARGEPPRLRMISSPAAPSRFARMPPRRYSFSLLRHQRPEPLEAGVHVVRAGVAAAALRFPAHPPEPEHVVDVAPPHILAGASRRRGPCAARPSGPAVNVTLVWNIVSPDCRDCRRAGFVAAARSARLVRSSPRKIARGAERRQAPWAHRPPDYAQPGTRLRGASSLLAQRPSPLGAPPRRFRETARRPSH